MHASLLRLDSRVPIYVLFILIASTWVAAVTQAESYPRRPIKIISPYSPGGLGDTLPRFIASGLSAPLGQQVIVDNRPGASQIVGTQLAARSAPDGYTLLFGGVTGLALNVSAHKSLPYDPVKDFSPVALSFTSPLFLFVNPTVPARNVRELITLAKVQPKTITFASGGVGSSNHLAAELFRAFVGLDLLHVPYKGAGAALIDLITGQVDILFTASGIEFVSQGKLRVLAVTSSQRLSAEPTIPTMQEAGVPGYEATIWWGIVAPVNTPKAIITRLAQEIAIVLTQPSLRERMPSGVEITPSTPEQFAAHIQYEITKWHRVIRGAGIALQE